MISGVMPRRRRDQISSGSVLSRPIRKKLTAISSSERVKISRPAAMQRDAEIRQRDVPERVPGAGAEVERGFLLRAVQFLQAGENFRGGDGDQRRAVSQGHGDQAQFHAHRHEQHQQRQAGDDPGKNQRQQNQAAKERLCREIRRDRAPARPASPSTSAIATATAATITLFRTESQSAPSSKSWRYHSKVQLRGGNPPTPEPLNE